MTKVRVRYPPSPTGSPHIGNIRTALFNWLYARHTGGAFVLRIEDTDRERFVEGAAESQMEALTWLGLDWDEGPVKGGDFGPYFQSERLDLYKKYSEQLIASGNAYRCYCTRDRLDALRKTQEERGLPTGYDRRCRFLTDEERSAYEASGASFVVRFAVPREGTVSWDDAVFGEKTWENRILDDHVLMKSDGFPTYHMANVVDDHLMEISHVIRGPEWLSSTPRHVLMYEALGWEPPTFVHVTNILGKDGRKLSKREAAAAFLNYKEEGYLPEALFNFMTLLGWSSGADRDIYSREELTAAFDLNGLVGHPAILDSDKLLWFNGKYIRDLSKAELARRTLPFLVTAGLMPSNPDEALLAYLADVLGLEQERMKTLAEAPALADFFLLADDAFVYDEKAVQKWLSIPGAAERLERLRGALGALETFDTAGIEGAVTATAEHFAIKNAEVIHPTRVAVTGRTVGPGLYETLAVLGKERVGRRLSRALDLIRKPSAGGI